MATALGSLPRLCMQGIELLLKERETILKSMLILHAFNGLGHFYLAFHCFMVCG